MSDFGVRETAVDERPCGDCAHYQDLICLRWFKLVDAEQHVIYPRALGSCWTPAEAPPPAPV